MQQYSATATMMIGLLLALGMGGLLLGWLALNTGSGFVGLLFIGGIVVGLATVLIGATRREQ
jgi:hypothetical protein